MIQRPTRTSPLLALVALLVTTFSFVSQHAAAQGAGAGDGSIRGRIADAQGASLPGVSITGEEPERRPGRSAVVSDADGAYRLLNLPPGARLHGCRPSWTGSRASSASASRSAPAEPRARHQPSGRGAVGNGHGHR